MEWRNKQYFKWTGLLLIALISSCATAKQVKLSSSDDLGSYKFVQISELTVSPDQTDAGENEANERIKEFYKEELSTAVISANKHLIDSSLQDLNSENKMLIVDGSISVNYGSRALRYWLGFVAGKGSATVTITANDRDTGQEKYNDVRTVELSGGKFGGSFEKLLKAQLKQQIQLFSKGLRIE